jgi:hypothetical protein
MNAYLVLMPAKPTGTIRVEAMDKAHAAFVAWRHCGGPDRPTVVCQSETEFQVNGVTLTVMDMA